MKRKPPITDELKLRQWCVEQAVRWPWFAGTDAHYPNAVGMQYGRPPSEPDVLKRAALIFNWISGK